MKRLISIVLSFAVCVTASASAFAKLSDIPYSERPLTVDIDGINDAINTLNADLQKPNNTDKVFEDYYALLKLASQNGDVRQINMLELEKLNYDIPTIHSREFINENIDNAVKYGNEIKMAVKSILYSRYYDDFKKYWGEDRTAHIAEMYDNSDKVLEGKQFYDRYFELTDKNADSLEFAKLLKELITSNNRDAQANDFDNFIDYLYTSDNTGFTAADIKHYVENTAGDYHYYVNKFKNYGIHLGLDRIDESAEVKNPLGALAYTKKLDPKISSAYDYLVKNGLFFLGTTEKHRGATAPMYSYGDAGIIVSGSDPMQTLIHEFGHYQSFLNTEINSEDGFFGEQYGADFQEFNSQAFELISTDYYEDIYGGNAQGKKFRLLITLMQQLSNIAVPAMTEITLYQTDLSQMSDTELDETLTELFGEQWYLSCQQFFTSCGNYINYSLMLFNALQLYDVYIHDKNTGIAKYLEACSYQNGSYGELTKKLGLKSAFDENAGDCLKEITDDIFKTEYDIDYTAALDYFENGVYLGNVFPTTQRVSVNGGEAQTLFAYNSNGYNYIRIRDLARLLSGTEQQFDVEYDTGAYTVNIISGKPYTSDGTEMQETEAVITAGQKSNGTFTLMRDGKRVLSGGAMFINGWNCYLLRGLAENGIIDLKIGYDAENNTVLISTR